MENVHLIKITQTLNSILSFMDQLQCIHLYMNDSIKGITFCLTFFPNCLAEQSLKKYEWKLMRNVKLCQFSTCKATAGITSHTMIDFNETQNVVLF